MTLQEIPGSESHRDTMLPIKKIQFRITSIGFHAILIFILKNIRYNKHMNL